jgi:hypothetical protein
MFKANEEAKVKVKEEDCSRWKMEGDLLEFDTVRAAELLRTASWDCYSPEGVWATLRDVRIFQMLE